MSGDVKTLRVRIEGRVQGVWYRAWTVQEATRLGLSGWVRNRRDRSVEALISGPPDRVDDMLALFGRGPPAARVTGVYPKPDDPPESREFVTQATV